MATTCNRKLYARSPSTFMRDPQTYHNKFLVYLQHHPSKLSLCNFHQGAICEMPNHLLEKLHIGTVTLRFITWPPIVALFRLWIAASAEAALLKLMNLLPEPNNRCKKQSRWSSTESISRLQCFRKNQLPYPNPLLRPLSLSTPTLALIRWHSLHENDDFINRWALTISKSVCWDSPFHDFMVWAEGAVCVGDGWYVKPKVPRDQQVDIWLFHPKNFLNFYTFCSKEIFFGCFLVACSLKKEP
jgi:hypothetical protein